MHHRVQRRRPRAANHGPEDPPMHSIASAVDVAESYPATTCKAQPTLATVQPTGPVAQATGSDSHAERLMT